MFFKIIFSAGLHSRWVWLAGSTRDKNVKTMNANRFYWNKPFSYDLIYPQIAPGEQGNLPAHFLQFNIPISVTSLQFQPVIQLLWNRITF
jgi:hypothetical protein